MQQVYRFGPAPEHPANHLFVFLHASGADARSMIPAAFKFQSRFPSAALIVPKGFARYGSDGETQQWFSCRRFFRASSSWCAVSRRPTAFHWSARC